jgi:uncharacterized protein YlxP (DUF503 family)
MTMVVGVLTIEMQFPGSRSLKDKRKLLQKIIERTRSRYNISIAEVSENDLWQRARIGIVAVSNGTDHIHSTLDNVTNFINYINPGEIIATEVEVLNF